MPNIESRAPGGGPLKGKGANFFENYGTPQAGGLSVQLVEGGNGQLPIVRFLADDGGVNQISPINQKEADRWRESFARFENLWQEMSAETVSKYKKKMWLEKWLASHKAHAQLCVINAVINNPKIDLESELKNWFKDALELYSVEHTS